MLSSHSCNVILLFTSHIELKYLYQYNTCTFTESNLHVLWSLFILRMFVILKFRLRSPWNAMIALLLYHMYSFVCVKVQHDQLVKHFSHVKLCNEYKLHVYYYNNQGCNLLYSNECMYVYYIYIYTCSTCVNHMRMYFVPKLIPHVCTIHSMILYMYVV